MALKLTSGAIKDILGRRELELHVVQILGFKVIHGANGVKYRVAISDGESSFNNCFMVNDDLVSRVETGHFEPFTIIQLDDYVVERVSGRQVCQMVGR